MKVCRCSMFTIIWILILLGTSSMPVFSSVFPEFPPSWLRVRTYVEYEGGMPLLLCFLNETEMEGKKEKFIFRWECTAMNGLVATLNLTLDVPLRLHISKTVNITTNTREILYPNGTVMGKACLWLPPSPEKGEWIVVSGRPPNEMAAEVRNSGDRAGATCQGHQEDYWVLNHTSKKEGMFTRVVLHVNAFFDLDTGLLLAGSIENTTTINCLGLYKMGSIMLMTDTNVDLGPHFLRTEIAHFFINTLPITIPAAAVVTIVIIKMRKRRKRRAMGKR